MEASIVAIGGLAVISLIWLLLWRRRNVSEEKGRPPGGAAAPAVCNKLVVGSPEDPDIEIVRLAQDQWDGGHNFTANVEMKSALQSLVAHAPGLAMTVGMASANNLYLLRFAPEVAQHLAEGSLELMKGNLQGGVRAIAVDAQGHIASHGDLFKISGASVATVATGIWQVLAIVTAQKFLSDINKQLARIEKGLGSIKDWLENEHYSRLQSNYHYLVSVHEVLESNTLNLPDVTTFSNQLEHIHRESSQEILFSRQRAALISAEFGRQELSGVGLKDHSREAIALVQDYGQCAQALLLGIGIKGLAAQLRSALPVNKAFSLQRIQEVVRDSGSAKDEIQTFADKARARVPELMGTFSFEGTDQEHQKCLRNEINTYERIGLKMHEGIEEKASQAEVLVRDRMTLSRQPFVLGVQTDEAGNVVTVRELDPAVVATS